MSELIISTSELGQKVESQPLWYAAYTSSRHEKRVAEHLRQRDIECFLPLYETVHRWNNGRHRVQLPLFPSYVFVRIDLRNKLRVLQVPGLAQIVSFNGAPAVLPDADIETQCFDLRCSGATVRVPERWVASGNLPRPVAGHARHFAETSRSVSCGAVCRNDYAFDRRRS
jgi:hypothetical protein